MKNTVKITRCGKTTTPLKIRKQCALKEGDRLTVEATEKGILFKPVPNLLDLAGIDAAYATVEQINKMIDQLREEY